MGHWLVVRKAVAKELKTVVWTAAVTVEKSVVSKER